MKLKFIGAAGEVTGSCYLLENQTGEQIVIDCGLFQGQRFSETKNYAAFPFQPQRLKAVLITHSHLDHIGRLPRLVGAGFGGSIYSTPPTRDLSRPILEDSFKIMETERRLFDQPVLYEQKDIQQTFNQWEVVEYEKEFSPASGFKVKFRNAGHILGSAFLEVEADGKRIVFSGDLGGVESPLIKPRAYPARAETIVIESTYGSRVHESHQARVQALKAAVQPAILNGGAIMIPAFALERTQELLYNFNQLIEEKKIPRVPIFLDSPLAIKITAIFEKYVRDYFNPHSLRRLAYDDDLLKFPGLTICRSVTESKSINRVQPPKIIIAGQGMMMGGRIIHHAKRYLDDPHSSLIFVGYQVKSTLGRRILEGEKEVKIFGKKITVRAHIQAIGAYSAHADQRELIDWIERMPAPAENIFITHGEPKESEGLKMKLAERQKARITLPQEGDQVSF